MPSQRKKRQEKRKKRGGEKAKSKSQDCCVTFKPKNEILLSAYARTSQADILHLDHKATKCSTCKPVCGKFWLFIERQWPENHSNSFKTRFSAKSPGANGLNSLYTDNTPWLQLPFPPPPTPLPRKKRLIIVFNFSLDDCNTQEKFETISCAKNEE